MTAEQVLVVLSRNKNKWLSCNDISKKLKQNRTRVNHHLLLLTREKKIVRNPTMRKNQYQWEYVYKIR
jgi:predicted transcriptional regulator